MYRKARVYFAKSLELLGPTPNPRAATGLLLTCSAIKLDVRGRKSDPDDELNAALGQLAASKLKAAYAHVDPFLRECNEKLLAAHAPFALGEKGASGADYLAAHDPMSDRHGVQAAPHRPKPPAGGAPGLQPPARAPARETRARET